MSKARMLRYLSPERAKLAWHFRRMAVYVSQWPNNNDARIYYSWVQVFGTKAANRAIKIVDEIAKADDYWIQPSHYISLLLFLELAIMDGTIDP